MYCMEQASKVRLEYWSSKEDLLGISGRPSPLSGRPHDKASSQYFKAIKCENIHFMIKKKIRLSMK